MAPSQATEKIDVLSELEAQNSDPPLPNSLPEIEQGDFSATNTGKIEASTDNESKDDPFIVDWDGPDDPKCPMNWPTISKATLLSGMAFNSLLTPLSSSMFAPGEADVLREFHSTDATLGSFVVSIFILGFMVGPLLIAPLSEIYGRLRWYHICNTLFLAFTIGCALSHTLPQLFIFRFFAGVMGSCPMALGSGTATDLISKEKRAGVMAIWAMGPIMGPVIGPIAGAFVCQKIGWRWVFWIISIATGAMIILTLICYRETYPPVLLESKAAALRKSTGDSRYKSKYDRGLTQKQIFQMALVRPIKLLFLSPIVLIMTLFGAVSYGYLYLIFTTITEIFEKLYGWNQGTSGLSFLGFGIGCLSGLIITGRVANYIALSHSRKGCFTPESRLGPIVAGSWLLPIGLFWYGWSADKHLHWIMPMLGTGIFGFGLMTVFLCINTYLVDSYILYAASVTAANAVLRSLVGAFLPLAGPSMYEKLGLGWGNSLLGFIAFAFCIIPVLLWKYGAKIRTHPRFQLRL